MGADAYCANAGLSIAEATGSGTPIGGYLFLIVLSTLLPAGTMTIDVREFLSRFGSS